MITRLTGRFWRTIAYLPVIGDIFWWYIQRRAKAEDKTYACSTINK